MRGSGEVVLPSFGFFNMGSRLFWPSHRGLFHLKLSFFPLLLGVSNKKTCTWEDGAFLPLFSAVISAYYLCRWFLLLAWWFISVDYELEVDFCWSLLVRREFVRCRFVLTCCSTKQINWLEFSVVSGTIRERTFIIVDWCIVFGASLCYLWTAVHEENEYRIYETFFGVEGLLCVCCFLFVE